MTGALDGRGAGTRARPRSTYAARTVSRGAEEPPPLRLTRRGRAVLITFAAGTLLVTFWLTAGPGARAGGQDDTSIGGAVPTDVVGPGETLWDVAERNDPDGDPRVTVQRIADLNGLSGSIVHPGQRLLVPAH